MPFVTTMPKLSPTMEEGTIAKWLKKEGEFVEANEPLLEITTDKATVEHTALDEGWLRKILIPSGKSAIINAPLAIFSEKKDDDISSILKEMEKKAEEKPKVQMESISPSDVGVQSAKGALRSEPIFTPEPPLEHYDFSALLKERKERYPKSPLAKKIAKERNLDITSVKGSGPHGRVEAKDLEHAKPLGMVPWEELELPETLPGSYDEIELSPMRKAIGRRLQDAKSHIPHFYLMRKIDAGALFELRRQLEQLSLKITYNDLILRGAALALRKHPALNTGFNSQNQTIIQFKTIDISVAVGFEGGLITPIIRHADYKSVHEISEEMSVLKERAKANKLKEHEYKGGSFTISNLGMYGVSEFIAVINPPQSSILAIANIEDAALVRGGQIVAGKMLMLSLACDHRVIDGADAAQFLGTIKTLLENPAGLLI